MTRDELFQLVMDRWDNSFYGIIANITMGMGKTRAGLAIAKKSSKPCMILTHSVDARDNVWPDEMNIWDIHPENTKIVQFDSVTKQEPIYKTIIIDECHLMTTAVYNFLVFNKTVNPDCKYLFLTGTLPDDDTKMKWLQSFALPMVKYSFMDALADGNANNIEFKIVYVDLDDTEANVKVPLKKGLFTEKGAYYELCKSIQIAKTQQLREMSINARMWFIYKSKTKIKALRVIHEQLIKKSKRHIIFTTTKEIADSFGPNVYHSGTDDTMLESFKKGELMYLASVEQLKVGANIPGLRTGVLLQSNAKKHSFEQVAGRLTRLGDNEISTIYIIVLKNTMDESWLAKATQGINRKYFKQYHLTHAQIKDYGV